MSWEHGAFNHSTEPFNRKHSTELFDGIQVTRLELVCAFKFRSQLDWCVKIRSLC